MTTPGRRGAFDKLRLIGWLAAALAIVAASDVSAQMRSPRGGRGGAQERTARGPQEPRPDALEQVLEELRQDLKLDAAQQPLWEAYADKVRALALDIARERGRAEENAKAPALKRIDHDVDVAQNRLAALEEIQGAAKALYAKLSPEQQRAADPRLATLIPGAPAAAPPIPSRQEPKR